MAWRGWDNAEIYDRFVREHRIYRRLNQRLVELAALAPARRVLDVGCGTGATALACLRVLDVDAELVGVDASQEMVEVARANILDPRASFVVAPAAAVARSVSGRFDRVVCNAAFWQFPVPAAALGAMAAVTGAGALAVLNVPAERVLGGRAPVHPFQVALARAIEDRTGRSLPAPVRLDPARVDADAGEAGFRVRERVEFVYRGAQSELVELMSIPAMIGPLVAGLAPDAVEDLLAECASRVDPDEPVEVPWLYWVLERAA